MLFSCEDFSSNSTIYELISFSILPRMHLSCYLDENYRQTLVLGISKENVLDVPDSLMYFLTFDFYFFLQNYLTHVRTGYKIIIGTVVMENVLMMSKKYFHSIDVNCV